MSRKPKVFCPRPDYCVGWRNAAAALYRVRDIPRTNLLDKELNLMAVDLRGKTLENHIEALLGPGDSLSPGAGRPNDGKHSGMRELRADAGPSFVRDPKAVFSDQLAIYLGCGPVGGSPGRSATAAVTTPRIESGSIGGVVRSKEGFDLAEDSLCRRRSMNPLSVCAVSRSPHIRSKLDDSGSCEDLPSLGARAGGTSLLVGASIGPLRMLGDRR